MWVLYKALFGNAKTSYWVQRHAGGELEGMRRPVMYHPGFGRKRRKKSLNRRQKWGVFLLFCSALLFYLGINIGQNLIPVMTEMAINEANELVTRAMNEAIHEKLVDGSFRYDELIGLERDINGNISALTTDMTKINTLQASITNEVLWQVGQLTETSMHIPLGNILGGSVLSGRGPNIPFRVLTLGNPSATFSNEFSTAGINQTKHQIMLDLSIDVHILVPGNQSVEIISTQMLVAETIIVGEVPNMLGNFGIVAQ